jgi:signal transduction histidine kinase
MSNPAKREKYSEIIASHVEAAANLVKNLQDFVSASRPKASYPVNVACALENALNKISDETRAKIKTEYNGGLLFAKADSKDLGLVYKNLLQNALEAGSQKISTTACAQNGTILTKISDDGRGISEEDVKIVFEPFFTTHDTVGHLGLGLATSKRIIEKYGGRILVESHPREGTIFTVELPAAEK